MPSRSEVAYFGAGPAPLPTAAIEKSAQAFVNFEDTGLSLAEISHRSPTANKILSDAKDALANLYDIPMDEYDILFMEAGGTGEFSAVVQNLIGHWIEKRRRQAIAELGEGKDAEVLERVKREVQTELKVDYLVTGSWSLKASQEATRLLGGQYVNVAVDARKSNNGKFGKIPDEKEWKLTFKGSAYTYYCDNETVDGVEFPTFPQTLESKGGSEHDERIVVADMSSNFLSRKIDVRKFGVIFGGAQKNLGIAGITVVIIRKSLLDLVPPPAFLHALSPVIPASGTLPPIIFSFPVIASNNSLYNTLPIFNLYVATVVLQMLVSTFGPRKVSGQEEIANKKAALIYNALDAHPDTYYVVPDKSVRSRMNICFRIISGQKAGDQVVPDEAKEKAFLAGAEKRGLLGLKGHRSVGGMRASNYNAVSLESAQKLADYLVEFARS
ncbi:Phosphoserine aminotransferase [Exophiala dermatitidis]|uniref:phosphoserine transaminase n=1 Tax=Exophiala dermatitidis (strain ATCC 34100 / CBS 525.76 / NIH/UT8656) TaxID=858893 RepID=H6BZ31_EXODN|nr:phosphoserine aminotransferase [Exophiala dermatitidis NIH/UT8656]EHY56894.1 phosphoserine aminotransferase [Exophiala dermatitidis NIH/UT8656]